MTENEKQNKKQYNALSTCKNCHFLGYKTKDYNIGRCTKFKEIVSLDEENAHCFIKKGEYAPDKPLKKFKDHKTQLELWDFSRL